MRVLVFAVFVFVGREHVVCKLYMLFFDNLFDVIICYVFSDEKLSVTLAALPPACHCFLKMICFVACISFSGVFFRNLCLICLQVFLQ